MTATESIYQSIPTSMNELVPQATQLFGCDVVGKNIYNTISFLEDNGWTILYIYNFLMQLWEEEENRSTWWISPSHQWDTDPYEQIEIIETILDSIQDECQQIIHQSYSDSNSVIQQDEDEDEQDLDEDQDEQDLEWDENENEDEDEEEDEEEDEQDLELEWGGSSQI